MLEHNGRRESTEAQRVWHDGPPPHAGWWNAAYAGVEDTIVWWDGWRWWDGERWSQGLGRREPAHRIAEYAAVRVPASVRVRWNDYWPEGARVPRIDPAVGKAWHDFAAWVLQDGRPVRVSNELSWQRWAAQRNAMEPHLTIRSNRHPSATGFLKVKP